MNVKIVVGDFVCNTVAGVGDDFALSFYGNNIDTFDALDLGAGAFGLAIEVFVGARRTLTAATV